MFKRFSLIILAVFSLVACSNFVSQEQTTNDLKVLEQKPNSPTAASTKEENTENTSLETDTIDPLAGLKHWEPTWQPGTYFTKNFPEHAWMDTLTLEDLIENEWLMVKKNPNQLIISDQYVRLLSARFSDDFMLMLPRVPIDSFILYTAHWYGVNNNFEFVKSSKNNGYRISFLQNYKGIPISATGLASIEFNPKYNGKPSGVTIRLARNLQFEYPEKPFPYDSLYVAFTDTLGNEFIYGQKVPDMTLNEWYEYHAYIRNGGDSLSYLKNELIEKYNGNKQILIIKQENEFYLVHKILASPNMDANYEAFFDEYSKELISKRNTVNH